MRANPDSLRDGEMDGCPEFGEARSLLVGGDLHGVEAEALRAHLDACAGCSRALAQEHWARRALQRAVPAERSPLGADLGLEPGFFDGLQRDVLAATRVTRGENASIEVSDEVGSVGIGSARLAKLAAAAMFVLGLAGAQWGVSGPSPVEALLEREARPLPAADATVWDRARPVQPLGLHGASSYPGVGCQGLGVRQRAAELVEVEDLDVLRDELGPDRR